MAEESQRLPCSHYLPNDFLDNVWRNPERRRTYTVRCHQDRDVSGAHVCTRP